MRVEGLWHNLGTVLLLPGFPISLIGLIGLLTLPWVARGSAVRPVLLLSVITFLVTSLVFPVSTKWGTFLHAAGPFHVLIVLSAMLTLDSGLARLGRRRGWTKQVAWLGATLGLVSGLLFSIVLLGTFGAGSRETARLYEELGTRMAAAGHPLDDRAGPVIGNFPIWIAETQRVRSLGLPDEPPEDVLDLARTFPGTRYLVLTNPESEHWPGDLEAGVAGAECFRPIDLGPTPSDDDPLADTTVYEIVCP